MANSLIVRTLTGTLFVGTLLTSLWLGGYVFLFFFGIVVFIGVVEIMTLITGKQAKGFSLFCASMAFVIFLLLNIGRLTSQICLSNTQYLSYALLFFIPVIGLFDRNSIKINAIGAGITGTLFLTIAFTSLTTIFCIPKGGTQLVLAFFCIIWTYDSFAYLIGSAIGRHRIDEAISPKKSWEGAIGGLVFAVVCSCIFFYFTNTLTLWQWIIYTFIICVFGTIGDFCESLLKRHVNVKDSGKVLPGHGGILDRFDSTIFAAPFILLYLQIILII